ncbi:MAG: AmmeMemoRadiSam system radical SAM enzyme [Syntrophobacteraceae bacterium]|nr:AmmeMemoRadiSam system radical SAM enzyme [Syntrophobacteraceae bacterium]
MISRRHFLKQCTGCAVFWASMQLGNPFEGLPPAMAQSMEKGLIKRKLSPYFTSLPGGRVRCDLCPRSCEVGDGARGHCRVRENRGGQYYSLVYGNPCAVHVDPIEKKPFFHVLPGSTSFSIATAGCNLNCKFCQNWEISQAQPDDTFNYDMPPERVVELARMSQCQSIASTYVEPTIFLEYMIEIGRLCRQEDLLKVMHSNGYIQEAPLKDLCKTLDAACIDLKGFTDHYYRELTGGTLEPVLATLKMLKEAKVHTEIVNLVIPGKNDSPEQIRTMCRWIRNELGPDVPLHFSRFYPLYQLKSLPPTPVATLEQAREIGREEGLHFVYIGNIPGHSAENTPCPQCKTLVIERVGYRIQATRLKNGKCENCGFHIPGIWSLPEAKKI